MKKLFTYLSVAMLAVAAVSCQKEMVVEEGNGNVTFTIQTPEVATKAIADGMNVNIVHYEIYKAEPNHKNSLTGSDGPLIKSTVSMDAKGASLTLNLLQGQEYVGLFWAQVDGKKYYNTSDLRNVTVSYAGNANVESRAAFCKSQVFSTGGNVKVVLERPFAQINLGTTLSSIDSAVNGYEIALENSTMEIVGAATTFNVATMTTGTETTDVAFVANTVPHNFTPSEVLTVNTVNYAYLGMNYILAAGNQATVDVKYTVSTDVGSITRTVPTVPVMKNHRTNLLGNLLTQETAIEIVVDERFAEPDLEPEAIHMAAAMGGEFTLTKDLELEAPVVVPANTNFVLNLNGKTIKNKTQSEEFGEGEGIIAYGNLTINGEGTVEASTMAVWARGADGANVTINGGTYKGCAEGFAKGGRSVIYASSGNTINIYGGTFESLAADKTSYADKTNGVYAALNVADNNGNINVYGGTFVKQNPAAPGTEPAAWNAAHPNGFVAEGATVSVEGDNYIVTPPTSVSSVEEIVAALAEGNNVMLSQDLYDLPANGYGIALNGGVINGNNHTLDFNAPSGNNYGIMTTGGTIANVTISGVFRAVYIEKPTSDVILDNVTIDHSDVCYAINTGTHLPADQTPGSMIVKNSTLAGWMSFANVKDASFTNVTFKQGSYYTNVSGRLLKPYITTEFKNCEFKADYYIDLSSLGADQTVTFTNCTVNGVALTSVDQLQKTTNGDEGLTEGKLLYCEHNATSGIANLVIK